MFYLYSNSHVLILVIPVYAKIVVTFLNLKMISERSKHRFLIPSFNPKKLKSILLLRLQQAAHICHQH